MGRQESDPRQSFVDCGPRPMSAAPRRCGKNRRAQAEVVLQRSIRTSYRMLPFGFAMVADLVVALRPARVNLNPRGPSVILSERKKMFHGSRSCGRGTEFEIGTRLLRVRTSHMRLQEASSPSMILSFTQPRSKSPTLHRTAPPNGAGQDDCVKLITGFYKPREGPALPSPTARRRCGNELKDGWTRRERAAAARRPKARYVCSERNDRLHGRARAQGIVGVFEKMRCEYPLVPAVEADITSRGCPVVLWSLVCTSPGSPRPGR